VFRTDLGATSLTPRFAQSKFCAPPLVPRVVQRSRLFEELDRAAGSRLMLVTGSPGAGKTTLLANWLVARPDLPFAWLSCDAGDNDPLRFVNGLVRAFRQGFGAPSLGEDTLALLGSEGEVSIDAIAALADDFQGLAGPRVLLIDDLHLASEASTDVLGQFLDFRPLSLQIVIATRSDPPLRLSRMRAREELVELRDAHLAFSAQETKGLFIGFDLQLPDRDIEEVHRRTEGWSTGLQLAALSIKASPDPVSTVRRAEVSSATVASYFVEEVLSRQPQEIIDFLLASSVLDELSADTCTAVIGSGAAAILEGLVAAHMFVTATSEQAGTYRYHQLIKEVLQAELHRRDPKREAMLHESVAHHLLIAGHAASATRHLLAAGDSATAFQLLSERIVRDVLTNPTVGSALDFDQFRPELFAGVPEVLVPLAAELMWRGAFDRGARAVALVRRTQVDPARDAALAVRAALVNTLYCSFVGEFGEGLKHRAAARSFETTATGAGVSDWIASLDALAMYCHTYLGDFREARQLADALIVGGTSAALTEVLCPGVISQAALLAGEFEEAAALAEATLQSASRLGFDQHFFAFHALRTLGQLAFERRDLQAAIDPVEAGLAIVNGSRPAFNYLAQVDRARIWAARGSHENALDSLPAARSALKSRQSILLAEADELEARLRVNLGDPRGAHLAAERLPPPRRAVVETIIALTGLDAAAAARALKGAITDKATIRSAVELQLLQANVALVGAEPRAPKLVKSALLAAQRRGFVQTVVDTAPQLLDHVVSQPDLYRGAEDFRPLVKAHLDAKAMTGSRPRRAAVDPLTDAETRVLAKMAEHFTLREIAEDLFVSINTVKTHSQHAYMKLGVNSRSAAISRATVLGLLQ
jgi:LuxR family transcriptional regulator, maltose regulon positive regulatory protein